MSEIAHPNQVAGTKEERVRQAFARGREWLAAALEVPSPFPWQVALLERLLDGTVPTSLDVPTGLGKTAVMAIWLVARACGAALPRRLVYVVDRRAVVDQATGVAEQLRRFVASTPEVRAALGVVELPISTLRGAFVDNRRWLDDPSSPAIILGTVDMVGSRLLFEGYGVSRRMRAYHAGFMGADTLVALDEAHLVPPFQALVEQMAGTPTYRGRTLDERAIVPPLQFMALTATAAARPAGTRDDTCSLSAADDAHPTVAKRLHARKHLVVRDPVGSETTALLAAIVDEVARLTSGFVDTCRIIVFCDKRKDAQGVKKALDAHGDAELIVGGRRVYERSAAWTWLDERTRPAFVIATSAGEVGVDLDADHMVGDLVAWERTVQRLGRVNRRGEGDARVVLVPQQPDVKATAARMKAENAAAHNPSVGANDDDDDDGGADSKPALKPEERRMVQRLEREEAVLRLLRTLPRSACAGWQDGVDASPGALRELARAARQDGALGAEIIRASTPAPLRPALSQQLVDAWAMTSLEEHTGRPPVAPWIRGWEEDDEAQTAVVWRNELPVDGAGEALPRGDVAAFFDAARPLAPELLEAETFKVREWLEARFNALATRTRDAAEAAAAIPLDAAGAPLPVKQARTDKSSDSTVIAFVVSGQGVAVPLSRAAFFEPRHYRDVWDRQLAGATLIVDRDLGGLNAGMLDPSHPAAEEVPDIALRVLRLDGDADARADAAWRVELELVVDDDDDGRPKERLLVETRRTEQATTEDGRSMSPRREQSLVEHQAWAESEARAIAERLRLPAPYCEMLALAARVHDEGKKAIVWQRAFNARAGGPWAKTTSRPNIKLLDGYRHELGSLLEMQRDPRVAALDAPMRDLCLHLVAAHHGFARPLIATRGCEVPPSALEGCAREIALRFIRLQKQWGAWGLAWWEAVLRAADQRASRANDEQEDRDG